MSWQRTGKGREVGEGAIGVVVATSGRNLLVRADADGQLTRCVSAGVVACLGDRVSYEVGTTSGGRLTAVGARARCLRRYDPRGREEVLASHLGGIFIVVAPTEPPFWIGVVDRFLVAAAVEGLVAEVVLNKIDGGVPDDVEAELVDREAVGVTVHRVSAHGGDGIDGLRRSLAASEGPIALVGPSGAGKTSLAAAILPDVEVGRTGAVSAFWGTGRHTTTGSTMFDVPGGGVLVDGPGIRSFHPPLPEAEALRDHFPGLGALPCPWRDCLHRPDEEGCRASEASPRLVASYRRLLDDVTRVAKRARGY